MWLWAIWLFVIAASFSFFEGRALKNGTPTLSRWVWNISKAYPPFPWIVGLLTGYLAAHFFWPCQGCPL